MIKKIVLGLAVIFVLIQFIRIDKTNPLIDESKDFLVMTNAPENIVNLMDNACYDCHGHSTKYPWYTNIAPVSWWIKGHINEGREHLNFATWGDYSDKKRNHKLEECAEEVQEKHMPFASYTWVHPEAKLSDIQREELVKWFKSLMI